MWQIVPPPTKTAKYKSRRGSTYRLVSASFFMRISLEMRFYLFLKRKKVGEEREWYMPAMMSWEADRR